MDTMELLPAGRHYCSSSSQSPLQLRRYSLQGSIAAFSLPQV
jgi:hypothetical protein